MRTHGFITFNPFKYACNLKASGKADNEIQHELQNLGLDYRSAAMIVDDINKSYDALKSRESRKNLTYGMLLMLFGLTILALTHYYNLQHTGYPYFLAFSSIVLGSLRLANGWYQHKIISG